MLELKAILSKNEIPANSDAHLVYALVGILPVAKRRALPVNLTFLIDAAFLSGDEAAAVNFAAILNEVVAGVDAESTFSVVVLKDTSKVYLSAGSVAEIGHRINTSFAAALGILRDTRVTAAITPPQFQEGLTLALEETRKNATPNRINRIVVITKRSIRCASDSEAAPLIDFAKKIRTDKAQTFAPVGIHAYAVGPMVNENLLIDLADLSGGRYRYISESGGFKARFELDTQHLSKARATDLTTELTLYKGVELSRAHTVGDGVHLLYDRKISERGNTINLDAPRKYPFHLGEIESKAVSAVLFEILAPSRPPGKVRLGLFKADAYIPYMGGVSETVDIVVSYKEQTQNRELALPLKKGIAQCASLRAFQQAEILLFAGDSERGLKLLQSSFQILQQVGEHEVAERVKGLISTITYAGKEEWYRVATTEVSKTPALDLKSLRNIMFSVRSEIVNSGLREIP